MTAPGRDDRAVSDVVGYALVVTLILTLVGVTYGAGMAELHDTRTAHQLDNAERAFGILESNLDDIVYRDATRRSTTLDAGGGTVGFGDPVRFNLTLLDAGETYSASVEPIVYRGDDGAVVYVNGALLRTAAGGSAMLREPPMVVDDRTVVPYVQTRPQGSTGVGGETTVRIRMAAASRSAYVHPNQTGDDYRVRFNVTTPRTAVWERYLTRTTGGTCTTTGQTVSCRFRTQHLSVSLARIDVRLGT